MVDPFEYLNYRKLLKDLYEERKAEQSFFSYRYIAQKVGFSSAGFFTNIIQGKRNISPEYIFKFAEVFKLNKTESEYFELLVNFDQAKDHVRKRFYFEKILGHKKSKIKITDAQHYEFYSAWFYTAIRELIDIYPFRGDYEELAKRVSPPIKTSDAKKAVELLEKIGFIRKREEDGVYEQTDTFITTGYEAKSIAINNFLMGMSDLAKEAIDRYPRDKRDISSLTFTVSGEGMSTILERLKSFRREVLEIVREDKSQKRQDRVYHINFHVFPLTKV
ncbi:MAG: TIGR02147 family protein [Chitinispirillaceae bacterium]|nr:TIGR02147 family protein [Chitinispirillaceae bacterium]